MRGLGAGRVGCSGFGGPGGLSYFRIGHKLIISQGAGRTKPGEAVGWFWGKKMPQTNEPVAFFAGGLEVFWSTMKLHNSQTNCVRRRH